MCTGGHSPGYFLLSFSWAAIALQVLALSLEHTNEYYNPFTSHEYFQKTNTNLKENIMLHSRLFVCLFRFFCGSFLFVYLRLESREYHKSHSFMLMLTAPPGVLCLHIFCTDTLIHARDAWWSVREDGARLFLGYWERQKANRHKE